MVSKLLVALAIDDPWWKRESAEPGYQKIDHITRFAYEMMLYYNFDYFGEFTKLCIMSMVYA